MFVLLISFFVLLTLAIGLFIWFVFSITIQGKMYSGMSKKEAWLEIWREVRIFLVKGPDETR